MCAAKTGASDQAFNGFKARYGGTEVTHARKLKALEDENAKLNELLQEAVPDEAILKDVAEFDGDARCEAGCCG